MTPGPGMPPLLTGGSTGPRPVARITRVVGSLIFAGCELNGRPALVGAAIAPSLLPYATAWTPPKVKIPGAATPRLTACGADVTPFLETTTCAVPLCVPAGSASHGTCALI